jgi:hypothetical protein
MIRWRVCCALSARRVRFPDGFDLAARAPVTCGAVCGGRGDLPGRVAVRLAALASRPLRRPARYGHRR